MTPRAAAALVLALVGGCAAPERDAAEVPAAPDAPLCAPIIDAHNRRVGLLSKVSSHGSLEFRWIDADDNEHFEPGVAASLWLDLPDRVAMHAEKVGNDLFWIGCDGTRYWIFDMMEGETTLLVNAMATPIGADTSITIHPAGLAGLTGLRTIVNTEQAARDAVWDPDRLAWRIAIDDVNAPIDLWIDRSGNAIRTVQYDADGSIRFTGSLDRYASVSVPGVSKAALPGFPTLLDIESEDGRFRIRLGLDTPTPGVRDRMFDLEQLRAYLRPAVVGGDRAP